MDIHKLIHFQFPLEKGQMRGVWRLIRPIQQWMCDDLQPEGLVSHRDPFSYDEITSVSEPKVADPRQPAAIDQFATPHRVRHL